MTDHQFITGADLEAAIKGIAQGLRETIEPLQERIAALAQESLDAIADQVADVLTGHEGRLAALERGTQLLRYRGRWQAEDASTYARGDVVSHRRCLYFCNRATDAAPGSNSGWSLMCRGVDAPPERSRPTRGESQNAEAP